MEQLQTLRGPADPLKDLGPWILDLAAWCFGLGLGLGFGLGACVGACVGDGVGAGVGATVGDAVGDGDGDGEGDGVWDGVGSGVGLGVGLDVGLGVGSGGFVGFVFVGRLPFPCVGFGVGVPSFTNLPLHLLTHLFITLHISILLYCL